MLLNIDPFLISKILLQSFNVDNLCVIKIKVVSDPELKIELITAFPSSESKALVASSRIKNFFSL